MGKMPLQINRRVVGESLISLIPTLFESSNKIRENNKNVLYKLS